MRLNLITPKYQEIRSYTFTTKQRTCQRGQTDFLKCSLVERERRAKHCLLVITCSVLVEQGRRKHGERLRLSGSSYVSGRPLPAETAHCTHVPDVGVIDAHDRNVAGRISDPRVGCPAIRTKVSAITVEARREAGQETVTVPCWISGKLIYLSTPYKHPHAHIPTSDSKRTHVEPMYCQSNEIAPNPRPSLPSVPPKRFVMMSCVALGTCCVDRQMTLMPFRSGKMYAGKTSHTNMPVNADQKTLRRLWFVALSK